MKTTLFTLLLATMSLTTAGQTPNNAPGRMEDAQYVIIPTGARSQVVIDSLPSRILGGNRTYTVLLPRNYDVNTEKKYPVVYLLHGIMDTNEGWYKNGRVKTVMDRMVESGEAEEMIVVTPNAGGNIYAGVWNGYFNMPGWNYEDFFFQEFLPHIESKYRIIGDRAHRAIGGLSMGGGGSTVYAQRHPDMFCAVYAMSALMTLDANGGLPSYGQEKMDIFNRSVLEHSAIDFIRKTDEAGREKLRSIRWFVDCGDDDVLFDVDIEFYQAMRKGGIPCQLRVRDGGHDWEYWHTALYTALPYFSRSFGR